MAKFTDNQLAKLFAQLTQDYNQLVSEGRQFEAIRDELTRRVLFALNNPASNLYWLNLAEPSAENVACKREADKVMHALYTFLSTRPAFGHVEDQQTFFPQPQFVQINIEVHDYDHYRHHHHCYCASDDFLFNWFLYRSLMRPQVIVIDNSSYRDHGRSKDEKKNDGDVLAYLFLIALSVLLAVLAFIAVYYMIGQALNSLDRIRYNEGWLQGVITMAGTVAAGYVSYFLSMTFAASPLMNLALLAGISSPVGIVTLSLACLTIIGAGVGCFLTDQLQNYVLRKTHFKDMDSNDPNRFSLTAAEEQNLLRKGFDLMRVKYALFTLRSEIGGEGVPTLIHSRFFGFSKFFFWGEGKDDIQGNLDLIRKIRAGDLGTRRGEYGVAITTVDLPQGNDTVPFDLSPLPYYQAPVYAMYPPPYQEPFAPRDFSYQ